MDGRQPLFEGGTPARTDQTDEDDNGDSRMTFDRRRSELEARSLRRLDLPRVYHENQIAELDAHNYSILPSCGIKHQGGYPKPRLQGAIVLAKRFERSQRQAPAVIVMLLRRMPVNHSLERR
jgi:hypothetical protein